MCASKWMFYYRGVRCTLFLSFYWKNYIIFFSIAIYYPIYWNTFIHFMVSKVISGQNTIGKFDFIFCPYNPLVQYNSTLRGADADVYPISSHIYSQSDENIFSLIWWNFLSFRWQILYVASGSNIYVLL